MGLPLQFRETNQLLAVTARTHVVANAPGPRSADHTPDPRQYEQNVNRTISRPKYFDPN